jgi:O-antigen/teichoic acid export membrane protein
LYGYSQKMSGLADVAILAAITVYAPQLRKLFVDNNKEEIEKITRLVCRLVFSFTLVALLVFSVAGDVFLQMFLPDMIEAYGLTIYMIVSKLVVSVFSFSALVMMMIVEKRRLIVPGVVLAIVNITSCYFLVSIYGLYGGVASNFLSVFLLNLLALTMVKKYTGIRIFIIKLKSISVDI